MVDEIMAIGEKIQAHQPELWSFVQKAAGNGGNPALGRLLGDFDRLDELLRKIQDLGIKVKDIRIGLFDFPCQREGRVIYLCWKYGEASIHFWHEVDSGFSGRQPIDWE